MTLIIKWGRGKRGGGKREGREGRQKGTQAARRKEEERRMEVHNKMLRLKLPLSKGRHPERQCPVDSLAVDRVTQQSSGKR